MKPACSLCSDQVRAALLFGILLGAFGVLLVQHIGK